LSTFESRNIIGILFLAQRALEDLQKDIIGAWRNLGLIDHSAQKIDATILKEEMHISNIGILKKFATAGLLTVPGRSNSLFEVPFDEFFLEEGNNEVFILKGVTSFPPKGNTTTATIALSLETVHHIFTRKTSKEIGIHTLHREMNRMMDNRCEQEFSVLHNFVGLCQPVEQRSADPAIRDQFYYLHPELYTILVDDIKGAEKKFSDLNRIDRLESWITTAKRYYRSRAGIVSKALLYEPVINKASQTLAEFLTENSISPFLECSEDWANTVTQTLLKWVETPDWIANFFESNTALRPKLEAFSYYDPNNAIHREWIKVVNRLIVIRFYLTLLHEELNKLFPKSISAHIHPSWQTATELLEQRPALLDVLYRLASETNTLLTHYSEPKIKRIVFEYEQEASGGS
jgi:hypothetical protein